MNKSKKLSNLLNKVETIKIYGNVGIEVNDIIDDSRKSKQGNLFVAIKGIHIDSHKFIPEVINKGVKVVVGEIIPQKSWLKHITYIRVKNSRKALSYLASAWHGNPSEKLNVIGVTGTDGKTTTVNLIYHTLKSSGKKVGMISTVDTRINDEVFETGLHVSNPEPLQLYKFLKEMVDGDCEYAVLEVTSHGLDQERTAGIEFDISVLTNITREHLDYHKTMEDYVKSKITLLNNSRTVFLNPNDKYFNKIKRLLKKNIKIRVYKFNKLTSIVQKSINNKFDEQYNKENAAAASSVTQEVGISAKNISKAILSFPGVEGRMQNVENKLGIRLIIDFAHTPAAIKKLLTEIKKSTNGRLISIVSAEGERDPYKRKKIAEISAEISDITILNPIDPRNENPKEILKHMIIGAGNTKATKLNSNNFKENKKVYIGELDRKKAIKDAIKIYAKIGDTIVICGKGHEKSMAIKGKELPWSDIKVVQSVLIK